MTKIGPVLWDLFAQKTERRVGEFLACGIALMHQFEFPIRPKAVIKWGWNDGRAPGAARCALQQGLRLLGNPIVLMVICLPV
jgi:hypothetical protein